MSESKKPIRLAKGDVAPNFELESDEYKHYALADFKHQNIVLYFYPKAMSSVCTVEAHDFRDNLNRLEAAGYTVIGVSGDDVRPLQEFREKDDLNFILLSDPEYKCHEEYGTVTESFEDGKRVYTPIRATFVIDGDGKITYADYDVDVNGQVDRMLTELEKLK
ncbi:MAG: peroxiredoxin [Bifidobacterium sp.]|nr:peroxiredoxin [Bifidobacterium sp.]